MNQLINESKIMRIDGGAKTSEPIYSIYLSGKITGDPDYLEKFETVAHGLRVTYPNAEVFNPASELSGIEEMLKKAEVNEEDQHDILGAVCLKMLERYQAIAMMPGWESSKGAIAEFQTAVKRGMPILALTEDWMP